MPSAAPSCGEARSLRPPPNVDTRVLRPLLALTLALFAPGCAPERPERGADGEPVRGGTLRLIGTSDVDHLSPSSAYTLPAFTLLRMFTRQLVSYAPTADWEEHLKVAADLARELPTTANGGVSDDGLTYTFHLRSGVRWDTQPPRALVAADVARGLEMMCNPVSPVGAPGYYRATIAGMSEFCDGFAAVAGTPDAIRAYVDGTDVAGVRAPDDSTVVITLVRPSSDLLHLLALPFASPMPVEALAFVPDGPEYRAGTISLGPYRITSYVAGREIHLGRNPAWDAATDPLRPAHVDSVTIVQGIDATSVQQQLEAGTADLAWDVNPSTAQLAMLAQTNDPGLSFAPPGDHWSVATYMPINGVSPNEGGALAKPAVRRALQYAVDRLAVTQVRGGPNLARPLYQAVVSDAAGHRAGWAPYPDVGERGDPEKAKRMLAEAGYPNGLTLKLLYQNRGFWPDVAQTVQASLAKAGVTAELVPATGSDFYARYLKNPESAARGVWDVALATWVPDWYGNNGRSVVAALFDGRRIGKNSVNYSSYQSADVDAAIDRALAASGEEEALAAWREAATRVMEDAAIVPLTESKTAVYVAGRVRGCAVFQLSMACDPTAVWLAP